MRPAVASGADVGICTGPLERALSFVRGDAYTWPLRSPRTARVVHGGVLGGLVAASVTGGVVGGGALSEA